ncbi:MAG: metallophosphoesterase family protein [Candidatus Omnitrophica bacterium]|nr:metallophosphoesterase family protein [Candidatus Omnitrophota bacterium]
MRYAIFSDIHSNLEAFESVLAAYENEKVDKYLCVGDIVGYGANPKECIKIVQDRKIITVAGNHDWASCGKFSIDYFNPYAKEAVLWTGRQINAADINYLNNLDLIYKEEDFCLVHGTLLNPKYFGYMFDIEDARDSFQVMVTSLCFVGHTHTPITFIKDSGKVSQTRNNLINIEPQKKYIINVGSVGQPRDGDNRGCFCIYDSKERNVHIKRVEYNLKLSQSKIIDAGLPSFLASRLSLGQ